MYLEILRVFLSGNWKYWSNLSALTAFSFYVYIFIYTGNGFVASACGNNLSFIVLTKRPDTQLLVFTQVWDRAFSFCPVVCLFIYLFILFIYLFLLSWFIREVLFPRWCSELIFEDFFVTPMNWLCINGATAVFFFHFSSLFTIIHVLAPEQHTDTSLLHIPCNKQVLEISSSS